MTKQEEISRLRKIALSATIQIHEIQKILFALDKDLLQDEEFAALLNSIYQTSPSTSNDPTILTAKHPPSSSQPQLDPFLQLRIAIADGTYQKKYQIGSTFLNGKIRLVDFRKVKLPDNRKTLAAIVQQQEGESEELDFRTALSRVARNGAYSKICPPELLRAVAPILLKTENYKGEIMTEVARFFLPTVENLGADPHNNPKFDKLVWDYYRDAPVYGGHPYDKRIFYKTAGRSCWTRSVERNSQGTAWAVESDGSLRNHNCITNVNTYAPAGAIVGIDINLESLINSFFRVF